MTLPDIKKELLRSAAQAYVLVGPHGLGKRAFAAEVGAQLLGISVSELATHPDYMQLEPSEDGKRAPSMDDVRAFINRLSLTTIFGRRVGVVPQADWLSTNAQNALLKTVEEPTAGTTLFLLVENEDQLLSTLRSRSIVLRLPLPVRQTVVDQYGLPLAEAARGLPSVAADLLQSAEARKLAEDVRAGALEFLSAPLWRRLVLATLWTKDAKKKGLTSSPRDRLQMLEDVTRQAVVAGDARAARLLAALPRAFADEAQNVNHTLIFEGLALSIGEA
jgi:hypothetical protein